METFESIVEVRHGSTVLVALGDPMWQPVAINGRQVVDVVALVRSSGVRAIPRGNEENSLTFQRCDEAETIAQAFKNELAWAAGLPRTMADVSLTFADGSVFQLANAAVESWSGGQTERLGNLGISITGGRLTSLGLTPSNAYLDPAGIPYTDPVGAFYLAP